MMEIRLHGALWRTATESRAAEWRRTLDELNAENALSLSGTRAASGETVEAALELVRKPDESLVVRVYPDGWTSDGELALAPETLAAFFDEYSATIRQMVHVDSQAPVRGFEALDMAKRAVHDEAADYLVEQLAPFVRAEQPDARRLFTLIFLVATDLPERLVRYHRRHG
ncbi:MAG: hypothetical protein ACI81R_002923 [Bradymonadia bacterium]|jgi:hypothetical protein